MLVLQVKMRNGDSYLTQMNVTLEEAEKFILAQKFIKLMYQGALVYLNTEDVMSVALQEPQPQESQEQVLDGASVE